MKTFVTGRENTPTLVGTSMRDSGNITELVFIMPVVYKGML